jgi:iron-sulfur cluster repair protein YtfE (RIC family)
MKIKDFMTHDHDRLERLLKDFLGEKDQDISRARGLIDEFKTGILKHIAWEEEILFPMIEHRTGMHMPGPTVLVQPQHQQIKSLLEKISVQIEKEGSIEGTLKELVDLLLLHNREEERILYPWIDVSLDKEDREEALKEMRQYSTDRK